jgi:hypothetical protein
VEGEASSKALRICIPSFGSPQWGDLGSQVSLEYLTVSLSIHIDPGDIMVLVFAATAASPTPACMR